MLFCLVINYNKTTVGTVVEPKAMPCRIEQTCDDLITNMKTNKGNSIAFILF